MDRGIRVLRASKDLLFPCRLRVVSRFTRAILAADDEGRLVTVLIKGRLGGPQSLVVESFPSRSEEYTLSDDADAVFCIDEATEFFDVSIPLCVKAFDSAQASLLLRFLDAFAPEESLFARAKHEPEVREIINGYMASLPEGPCPLISGFGCGLTPSTDDFLLGALSCAAAMGSSSLATVRKNIQSSLVEMSPVSKSMLSCALDGRYPEVILNYLKERNTSSLLAFMRHGATSGFDTVLGIYALLSAEGYAAWTFGM